MSDSMFQADSLVCDILTNHPQTFQIFETYGMCESCAAAPPPVPLHHFAMKHDVELNQLIGELTACASSVGG